MRSTLKLSAAATLDQLDRSIIDWCQTHNYRMYSVPFVSNSLLAANHPLLVFPHPFYSESNRNSRFFKHKCLIPETR